MQQNNDNNDTNIWNEKQRQVKEEGVEVSPLRGSEVTQGLAYSPYRYVKQE